MRPPAFRKNKLSVLFWSIGLPGFGQLLNGKPIKAILFIALEFLINVQAGLNTIIMLSFRGQTEEAVRQTNFQWLLFYPCIYMFAMWDAYRDADGEKHAYDFWPFVLTAFLGTVGIFYSPDFRIGGLLFGPVWLPMITAFLGTAAGLLLRRIFRASVAGSGDGG